MPLLQPVTHPFPGFALKQPNRYRRVVQVIDLLTLDLNAHKFKRERLAAAVLIIEILAAYEVVPNLENLKP